jgi:hypothetical protein
VDTANDGYVLYHRPGHATMILSMAAGAYGKFPSKYIFKLRRQEVK